MKEGKTNNETEMARLQLSSGTRNSGEVGSNLGELPEGGFSVGRRLRLCSERARFRQIGELWDGNGGDWGVPVGWGGPLVGWGNSTLVYRAEKLTGLAVGCLFQGESEMRT